MTSAIGSPASLPEAVAPVAPTPPAVGQPAWNARIAIGLAGILVAAMMSGLNNRVGSLTLVDMAGARGLAADDAHLLQTVYAAAELAAMPIAAWFATTLSLRRFHMGITLAFMLCAVLLPLAPSFSWLVVLRTVQGLAGGAMIPVLMSAALRFLPGPVKLQGLGFYSLTATFSPNLALWLAATWTDGFHDWRLTFWQVIPVGFIVLAAIWWGIPKDPAKPERFREMNVTGLICGPLGLALLAYVLDEGQRLDWLHSTSISGLLIASLALIGAFLISEWFHPAPFIRLQLLVRRNYHLGFPIFIGILVVSVASALLPALQLAEVQRFRPQQIAPIGLIISLPQLVLAPLVSWLLYRKWVDARHVVAIGLLLIAASCWLGASLDSEWMVEQFWTVQLLQMIGQPLAVVAFLYLAIGITAPAEGPYMSGLINTLKTIGSMGGAVLIEHLVHIGVAAHMRAMIDRAGRIGEIAAAGDVLGRFEPQAITLAITDIYLMAAALALLLIPPTLLLTHVPAPSVPKQSKD